MKCKLHNQKTNYESLGKWKWRCCECGGVYKLEDDDRDDFDEDGDLEIFESEKLKDSPVIVIGIKQI